MVGLTNSDRMFSEAFRDSMAQMDTTKAFQSVETLRDNATALEGSCVCGKVHIKCNTNMPFPFMVKTWSLMMSFSFVPALVPSPLSRSTPSVQVCHCISCRKTGGVYCVNVAAEKDSLEVKGREEVKSYRSETCRQEIPYNLQDSLRRPFRLAYRGITCHANIFGAADPKNKRVRGTV